MTENGIEPITRGAGRHALWGVLEYAAVSVTNVALASFGIRWAGPLDFGRFSVALSIASLMLLTDLGLSLVVQNLAAKYLGGDSKSGSKLVASVKIYAIICLVLSMAVAAASGAGIVVSVPGPLVLMGLLVALGAVLSVLTLPVLAIARARYDFRGIAFASGSRAFVTVGLLVAFGRSLGLVHLGFAYLGGLFTERFIISLRVRAVLRDLYHLSSSENDRFRSLPSWRTTRHLLTLGLPLFALGVGSHIVGSTDDLVIAGITGSAAVAWYRIGAMAPRLGKNALHKSFDVVFPRLAVSTNHLEQENAIARMNMVWAILGGAGYGIVWGNGEYLLTVFAGVADQEALLVLYIFVAVWITHLPFHGYALLLIARDRQRSLVPLVLVESVGNLLLTLVLVSTVGPTGAAWATLLALAFSNLLVAPILLRAEFSTPIHRRMLSHALIPAVGSAVILVGVVQVLPNNNDFTQLLLSLTVGAPIAIGCVVGLIPAKQRTELVGIVREMTARTSRGKL